MAVRTEPFVSAPIPVGTKGVPAASIGRPASAMAEGRWGLFDGDVLFPACILKRSAIDGNRAAMREFLRDTSLHLAPHGKTTMAPQLFALQEEDGVWGFTAATVAHVQTYRQAGIDRIFYANQLVDPTGLSYVLDELAADPAFEFLSLVDSARGARLLAEAALARGLERPLDVLIEIGMPGTRGGVRTEEEAIALVSAIDALPQLRLRGVEAFEGVVSLDRAGAERVRRQLDLVRRTAAHISTGLPGDMRLILSAGGSAFLEQVAEEMAKWPFPADYVLRSGCYITNDHGMYARAQRDPDLRGAIGFRRPFQPAIEVWGHVLSRPEPNRVIVGIGKRDISYDIEPPRPVGWARRGSMTAEALSDGLAVSGLNDQHAWITLPVDHPIDVGDLMAFGCSHPCTTFDKWKYLLMVDDDYRILDAVVTQF